MTDASHWPGIPAARIVAVIAYLRSGSKQIGSGYLVAENVVVTAEHCTRDLDTGEPALHLELVRKTDGLTAKARIAAQSPSLDIAVLRVADDEPLMPGGSITWGRIDRTYSGDIGDCKAIGYPLFQYDQTAKVRASAEVSGTIRATDEHELGFLLLRDPLLESTELPSRLSTRSSQRLSKWGGLSGSLVFVHGAAVGVIVGHSPRQGRGAVRIRPLAAVVGSAEPGAELVASELSLPSFEDFSVVNRPSPSVRVPLRGQFRALLDYYSQLYVERTALAEVVERFLASAEAGWLILSAPAGYGKTAFCASLYQSDEASFAAHFFNRGWYSDWLSEDWFLENLLEQFRVPVPPGLQERRALMSRLLEEPFSQTILIDAVDEATFSMAPYIGRTLASGSKGILTVRDVGVPRDSWLRAQGIPAKSATWVTIPGLSTAEVVTVINAAGPLATAAIESEDGLRTALRALGGTHPAARHDPFHVRIVAEDLSSGWVTIASLRDRSPGLEDYFHTWWQQLAESAYESKTVDLLGLMATALGPMSLQDLEELSIGPRLDGLTNTTERALGRVERFITRSAAGYSLIHPRFRQYIMDRRPAVIDTKAFLGRIKEYCRSWRDNGSEYAVRFLLEHMAMTDPASAEVIARDWDLLERLIVEVGPGGLQAALARAAAISPGELSEALLRLSAVVEREAHHLPDPYVRINGFATSQIGLRAISMAEPDVVGSAREHLKQTSGRSLVPRWTTAHTNPGVARILESRDGPLSAIAVTSAGDRCVAATHSGQCDVWNIDTGERVTRASGHRGGVSALAISPDGQSFLTGGRDAVARLWQMETGNALMDFAAHDGNVAAVSFSADGQAVATGSWDHSAIVWSRSSDRPRHVLGGHSDIVVSTDFSPSGRCLITGSWDGTARIWSSSDGTLQSVLNAHSNGLVGASFVGECHAITFGWDSAAGLWDAQNGSLIRSYPGHQGGVVSADVDIESGLLATIDADGCTRIWNLFSDSRPSLLNGHNAAGLSVKFLAGSTRLVSTAKDKTMRLWDVPSLAAVAAFTGHSDQIAGMATAADQALACTASWDGTAIVWDLGERSAGPAELQSSNAEITTSSAAAGHRAAFGMADGTIRLLHSETGEVTGSVRTPRSSSVVEMYDGGNRLIAGGDDGIIRIWDSSSLELIDELRGHTRKVNSICVSEDRASLASVSDDGLLMIWSLSTSVVPRVLSGHATGISQLVRSDDLGILVTGGWDGAAQIWQLSDHSPGAALIGHTGSLVGMSVLPDVSQVITIGTDSTIRVWTSDGQLLSLANAHEMPTRSCSIAPNLRWLATAGGDAAVKIWTLPDLRHSHSLNGHTDIVTNIEFCPDSDCVLTSGLDGTVRLWGVDTGAQLGLAMPPRNAQSIQIVWNHGTGETKVLCGDQAGSVTCWDLMN